MEKLKIGVLLSGSGTNLQAIIDEIANGLPVEIVRVLSSRPDAYGIERARAAG
ncbi:MAG: formyltransferase family protein, partial [Eggerthella lenta]